MDFSRMFYLVSSIPFVLTLPWVSLTTSVGAFSPTGQVQYWRSNAKINPVSSSSSSRIVFTQRRHPRQVIRYAGGFEWEDPTESVDQGVENPFKNPELTNPEEGLKIDPARLLGPRLNGSNLYLIGMMGSGKSSVGDKVARRMGTYKFLDTDEIIEKATGMKIPEIFDAEGEEGFRKVESQILDSVHSYVRCVVSTGGGLVNKMENWAKLHTGMVVWLDVDPEVIMKRIEGTDRPLLQTEDPLQTLKDLLDDRKDKYSQADLRIEVSENMDEEEVVSKIVFDLHNYLDDNPPAWKLAKLKAQSEGLDWVK